MKATSEFTFDAATGEPAPPTKVIPNTEARHDVQELLDAYNATIRGQGAELERLRHQLAEAHKEIERLRVIPVLIRSGLEYAEEVQAIPHR